IDVPIVKATGLKRKAAEANANNEHETRSAKRNVKAGPKLKVNIDDNNKQSSRVARNTTTTPHQRSSHRSDSARNLNTQPDVVHVGEPEPPYELNIAPDAACAVRYETTMPRLQHESVEKAGTLTEINSGQAGIPRELVLGLDFGSSCTKAVIHDCASSKSFAVEFGNEIGVQGFLVPSSVEVT